MGGQEGGEGEEGSGWFAREGGQRGGGQTRRGGRQEADRSGRRMHPMSLGLGGGGYLPFLSPSLTLSILPKEKSKKKKNGF